MGEDLKWLIGILVSMGIAFIVALIGTFRSLSASIKEGDDNLHNRVNRVRDEYARRDDLDGHIGQLRSDMKEFKEEFRESSKEYSRETNKRLDQVVVLLAQEKK